MFCIQTLFLVVRMPLGQYELLPRGAVRVSVEKMKILNYFFMALFLARFLSALLLFSYSRPLSLSHTHTLSPFLSLTHSLTHSFTHCIYIYIYLSHNHSFSLTLFLSWTHFVSLFNQRAYVRIKYSCLSTA